MYVKTQFGDNATVFEVFYYIFRSYQQFIVPHVPCHIVSSDR